METIPELTSFFGWALIINSGLLIVSTLALFLCRKKVTSLHSKLFGMNEENLPSQYFRYLANFKVLIIVFNLTPWIALKIMGAG